MVGRGLSGSVVVFGLISIRSGEYFIIYIVSKFFEDGGEYSLGYFGFRKVYFVEVRVVVVDEGYVYRVACDLDGVVDGRL